MNFILRRRSEASEAEMKDEADKLRARAAAGEDPAKLQQEANDFAGNKSKATNVKVENMRKANIPPTDAAIFDLKAGEVSQVFSDATGYRIYKVTEIKDLPLASVHDEDRARTAGTKHEERVRLACRTLRRQRLITHILLPLRRLRCGILVKLRRRKGQLHLLERNKWRTRFRPYW